MSSTDLQCSLKAYALKSDLIFVQYRTGHFKFPFLPASLVYSNDLKTRWLYIVRTWKGKSVNLKAPPPLLYEGNTWILTITMILMYRMCRDISTSSTGCSHHYKNRNCEPTVWYGTNEEVLWKTHDILSCFRLVQYLYIHLMYYANQQHFIQL